MNAPSKNTKFIGAEVIFFFKKKEEKFYKIYWTYDYTLRTQYINFKGITGLPLFDRKSKDRIDTRPNWHLTEWRLTELTLDRMTFDRMTFDRKFKIVLKINGEYH